MPRVHDRDWFIPVGILVVIVIIAAPILFRFFGSNGEIGTQVEEWETIGTAIQRLMVDNDLTYVDPSTSGDGGEKIRSTGSQFHETLNLQTFMGDQDSTKFCYRWGADGRITHEYDVDDNDDCGADTDQLFPRSR